MPTGKRVEKCQSLGVTRLTLLVRSAGTSHCYDMYPNDSTDSAELLAARQRIKEFVQAALYDSPAGGNAPVGSDV